MATHSSVLAWRIPGTGEPGELPSVGLHGVGTRLERLSSSSSSRDCLCTVFCIFNVLLEFYFNFFFWSGNQLLNFFDQFSLKIFQSTNFCLHLINSFLLFSSQLLGLTTQLTWQYVFPSVQFSRSVMSDSLRPYGLQHARLPCPSPTSWACSNSCPSSWWCHPTISSSVIPFSSCL